MPVDGQFTPITEDDLLMVTNTDEDEDTGARIGNLQ